MDEYRVWVTPGLRNEYPIPEWYQEFLSSMGLDDENEPEKPVKGWEEVMEALKPWLDGRVSRRSEED